MGYSIGAIFSGVKVELVKKVKFGVKCVCGIPWCMVQTTKNQSDMDQDIKGINDQSISVFDF